MRRQTDECARMGIVLFSVFPSHPEGDKEHIQAQHEQRVFTVMLQQCLTIVYICNLSSISISLVLLNSGNNPGKGAW